MSLYISKVLTPFLYSSQRPEATLSYHELQGFLFTVACSPVLIRPSEWLPLVFNDQDAGYADDDEAQSVLQALIDLYNVINGQILLDEVAPPDDITFKSPALENIGETATLGQWSKGFLLGHNWLMDTWNDYLVDELEKELSSSLIVLSFFASQNMAQVYHDEIEDSSEYTLGELADEMLGLFPSAMMNYAELGESIRSVLDEHMETHMPHINEDKIGRNDPCPCGSGKKYKKCCLH